jgi:hypothetical protein
MPIGASRVRATRSSLGVGLHQTRARSCGKGRRRSGGPVREKANDGGELVPGCLGNLRHEKDSPQVIPAGQAAGCFPCSSALIRPAPG